MAEKQNREQVQQTFRQFAWNLAGTLADRKTGATKAQPGRAGAGRSSGSKRG